jgi:hypothetical protein
MGAGLLRADCKPSRRGKLIRPCYLSESCSVGVGFCQRKGRRVKLTSSCHQTLIKRVYIPFSRAELNQIDSWSFAKHIRDRSEAVRVLVFKALASERSAGPRR